MGFSRAGRVNECGVKANVGDNGETDNNVSAVSPERSLQASNVGDDGVIDGHGKVSGEVNVNDKVPGGVNVDENDDENVGEMSSDEAIIPKGALDVCTPTQREIDEHNLNHLPFRS